MRIYLIVHFLELRNNKMLYKPFIKQLQGFINIRLNFIKHLFVNSEIMYSLLKLHYVVLGEEIQTQTQMYLFVEYH